MEKTTTALIVLLLFTSFLAASFWQETMTYQELYLDSIDRNIQSQTQIVSWISNYSNLQDEHLLVLGNYSSLLDKYMNVTHTLYFEP